MAHCLLRMDSSDVATGNAINTCCLAGNSTYYLPIDLIQPLSHSSHIPFPELLTTSFHTTSRNISQTTNQYLDGHRFPQQSISMSGVAKGIGDLFASVFEIIKGIFQAIGSTIATAFSAVTGLIGSVFDLFEGMVGFVLGKHTHLLQITSKLTRVRQHLHYRHDRSCLLRICLVSSTTGQVDHTTSRGKEVEVSWEENRRTYAGACKGTE